MFEDIDRRPKGARWTYGWGIGKYALFNSHDRKLPPIVVGAGKSFLLDD
jgi:hypothetical protein